METIHPINLEGSSCTMSLEMPAPGVILLSIEGHDIGEFGSVPMERLGDMLGEAEQAELFIDARSTRGATVGVSSEWALWLGSNRARLRRIHMLVGSPLIRMTAGFVRDFSGLEDLMQIHTDEEAFDDALGASVAGAGQSRR